ncbi:hypothetical protein RHSIM_Rhsim03G0048300 [Rhododendron simsii]|uniref:Uncharacterized protein n=1 Tax=Rhododendron simsii TaxID=118357 RepID=A0A834H4N1_RHOSS|nr:hypothetical protein RHSIM_Rhsim03G0048300 [Rhododendron simsii]
MPDFLRLTGFGDGRRNWCVEEIFVLWRLGEEDRKGLMAEEASDRSWRVPQLGCSVESRMAFFSSAFLAEAGRLIVTDVAGNPA